ncbi:hypothetical protein [Paracoccus aminovorans]|uniref:hypothetical protein n=1 Tax=Paracoccus aminovorans TaxID=34004 RepID=UPI002B25C104|nr:hypothetical protein [Paracoccus aminovorans]
MSNKKLETMAQSKDNAVWGRVTLAMPQLVEWRIESGAEKFEGRSLKEFMAALAPAGEGREVVLRLNLLVFL